MCHENKMGAAKEQHPYINQVDIVGGTGWNRGWNRVEQWNKWNSEWNSDPSPIQKEQDVRQKADADVHEQIDQRICRESAAQKGKHEVAPQGNENPAHCRAGKF